MKTGAMLSLKAIVVLFPYKAICASDLHLTLTEV